MGIKNQWNTIKNNWIIVLVLIVIVVFFMAGGNTQSNIGLSNSYSGYSRTAYDMEKAMVSSIDSSAYYGDGYGGYYYDYYGDFAPQVEERKITKTASIGAEVKRGTFKDAEARLKAIVASSDSFLLNENVAKNRYGSGDYFSGSYSIKVDTEKYDYIVQQLREIGELTYFNENARDITGSYTNKQIELQVEKERLERYREMYTEAKSVEDKINLNDRIFNQERTIKYLEDSLSRMDQKVDYTTISVSITEKTSSYANIVFVKFSDLARSFVQSLNVLLKILFILVPYAALLAIILFIVRILRKAKK